MTAERNSQPFLARGGEMGCLMRALDWSQTPVGSPDTWPKSLQTMVAVILHSKFPMFVWWGPSLVCFYNDAYRPSLGEDGKHPGILGMKATEAWPEIWDIISPLIQQVLDGGGATWFEDRLVPIFRNGHIEDVYWTFSYSPINDDAGMAAGVLVTCVETTEKVINQRKLAETTELLAFATEAAELGTWDYDPQGGRFKSNQRLKDWFGIGEGEETELTTALNTVAEQDRERVIAAIEAALDSERRIPYDIEYRIIHPHTKKETVVLAKGKPFFDEQGKVLRFSGTLEDITAKDIAKQLQEESNRNLRNLVEQAPVAMCVLKGPDHIVEIANEKMISLWGKQRDEVMHIPIFEGLPEAKGQGLESLLDAVFQTGERFLAQERPVELPRQQGLEKVYQNFVYEPLYGNEGRIEGVIAVTLDVTEQVIARRKVEEAEERARLAAESGNLGTFDYDITRGELFGSTRYYEIFDTCPGTPVAQILEVIHPDDRHIREKAMDRVKETGNLSYEVRVIRKDGTHRWVRVEGRGINDSEGRIGRLLGTILDFTDIKELEQKREEYIAIASHELRNPLTSLKLGLDLLDSLITDPQQKQLMDKSKEQVRRLVTMTSELLNVSKISSGILDLKPEIFNLQESITESIATVQAGVPKNQYEVSGSTDINVQGDKFRIDQVMVNLISNASKYSPKGSKIEIHVGVEKDCVKVQVKDKGIGIDPENLGQVFKKFSRLDPSGITEGYGLGLYISDQIIRKHGGIMGVESEKGKGSTFWFTLPH